MGLDYLTRGGSNLPLWAFSAMEDIFSAIYRGNFWGNDESRSGPGSTRARAADFVPVDGAR
jgi:hypothetical protein